MTNWILDDLQYKGLSYYQPKDGYRSSEDALIIQKCILNKIGPKFCGDAFEFGTGCGLISLLLALKIKNIQITAIDIQESLIQIARKNVHRFDLKNQIETIQTDIRKVKQEFAPDKFDLCFANPPFFPKSAGRLSPNKQKQIARHEILSTMDDVLNSFEYLLKKGKPAFIIYPITRLHEIKAKITARQNLKINNLRYFKNLKEELKVAPRNLSTKFSFCAEMQRL